MVLFSQNANVDFSNSCGYMWLELANSLSLLVTCPATPVYPIKNKRTQLWSNGKGTMIWFGNKFTRLLKPIRICRLWQMHQSISRIVSEGWSRKRPGYEKLWPEYACLGQCNKSLPNIRPTTLLQLEKERAWLQLPHGRDGTQKINTDALCKRLQRKAVVPSGQFSSKLKVNSNWGHKLCCSSLSPESPVHM